MRLTAAQARRVALAAQGLGADRPSGRLGRRHLRRAMEAMGVLQIDSVNVLARSQELPLFARLGPHPRSLIPDAVDDGFLWEYLVHQASFALSSHYPLHRWRMDRTLRWSRYATLVASRPGFLDSVYERVATSGPVVAGDLSERVGPRGTWWDYDDGKVALESLFYQGRLAVRRRARDFARIYDLPSRVLPPSVLSAPVVPESDARKELLLMAARYCGVGTFGDLADYHRQKPSACRHLLKELVVGGQLVEVAVAGWDEPAYVLPDLVVPRSVSARALLSPFDPVVWNRERALRLFGFHYRIEIYTPAPKRRYGYYVLPFLLGDELVGRVDLKADRTAGALMVQAAWVGPEFAPAASSIAGPLAAELAVMASWLGLPAVVVVDRGDLAPALRSAV